MSNRSIQIDLNFSLCLSRTYGPVEITMGHAIRQELVVVHRELRDVVFQDAVIRRIYRALTRLKGDQKEVLPARRQKLFVKEVRETFPAATQA